jgi:hypothetical protein
MSSTVGQKRSVSADVAASTSGLTPGPISDSIPADSNNNGSNHPRPSNSGADECGENGRGAKLPRTAGVPWTAVESNGAASAPQQVLPAQATPDDPQHAQQGAVPTPAPLTQAQILELHENAAAIAAADMARAATETTSAAGAKSTDPDANNRRAAYNKMRAAAAAAATPKVPFYAETPPPASSGVGLGAAAAAGNGGAGVREGSGARDRSASASTDPSSSRDQGGRLASNDSTWSALDTPSPSQRNNGAQYFGMEEEQQDSSMTATPVQFRRASSSISLGFASWKVR